MEESHFDARWNTLSNIPESISQVVSTVFKRDPTDDVEYIVVMPDYVGQGLDSGAIDIHPYVVYPEIEELDTLPAEDGAATLQRRDLIGVPTVAATSAMQLISAQDIGAEVRMNPDLKDTPMGPGLVVVHSRNTTLSNTTAADVSISDAIKTVKNATLPIVKTVGNAVTDAVTTVKNATLPVVKTVENTVTDVINTITDALDDTVTVQGMHDDIRSVLHDPKSNDVIIDL